MLITNELIRKTFNEANMDDACAGVITWMHTFYRQNHGYWDCRSSAPPPSYAVQSGEFHMTPLDMDFMNENLILLMETENFGHIFSLFLAMERKVVAGYRKMKLYRKCVGSSTRHPNWCDPEQSCTCDAYCRQICGM